MASAPPIPTPLYPAFILPHDPDFATVITKSLSDTPGPQAHSFLYLHSEAIKLWLHEITATQGTKFPVFEATPKAAFGEYKRLLSAFYQNHDPGKLDLVNLDKPPLPYVTFTQKSMVPLRGRLNPNLPIRNLRILDSEIDPSEGGNHRTVTWSRPPAPYELSYQIDIWTDYRHTHAHIIQQVAGQFWNSQVAYWGVRHPFIEQSYWLPIRLGSGGFDNSTDQNPAGETVYRHTIQITVEALMFFDEMAAKTILTDTKQFFEQGSDEILFTKSEKFTSLAPPTVDELALITHEEPGYRVPAEPSASVTWDSGIVTFDSGIVTFDIDT